MTDTNNKRPAEIQLSKDNATESDKATDGGSWGRAPEEVLSERRILKAQIGTDAQPASSETKPKGFSGYTINPFAAAAMGPPVFKTSPRSPKNNPFSSPSPTPNPFMSYNKGNNYWSKFPATTTSGASKDVSEKKSMGFAAYSKSAAASTNTDTSTTPSVPSDKQPDLADTTEKPDATASTQPTAEGSRDTEESAKQTDETEEGAGGNEEGEQDGTDNSPPVSAPSSPIAAAGVTDNGEGSEECVMQLRAKLFRLSKRQPVGGGGGEPGDASSKATAPQAEWVEIGTGPVRVLRPRKTAGEEVAAGALSRLVMRRESQAGGVGTKLILNVLLDASVTIAKQAERASRLTCFVTETEETSASASHSSTSETASSVDLLLKPGSEADVTAEGGSGGGNSKGDDEDKSKVVPVSYLIKTKLVKETDELVALVRECVPASAPAVQK